METMQQSKKQKKKKKKKNLDAAAQADSLLMLSFGRLGEHYCVCVCVYIEFDSMERVFACAHASDCKLCYIVGRVLLLFGSGISSEDVENSSSKNELWPLLDYC